jgi:hypothetical protein
MTTTTENPIEILREDLFKRPSPSVLLAARWLHEITPREYLPDWVEILANGNLDYWADVCSMARFDILEDEHAKDNGQLPSARIPDGAQRGQSFVEVAVGLALLAFLFLIAMGVLTETPAGRAMRETAAGAAAQLEAAASSHAVEKHGSAALDVAAELSCSGPIDRIQNPESGRWANTCQTQGGKFGILIESESGECITCFIKEKFSNYEQVLKYLENRGYLIRK